MVASMSRNPGGSFRPALTSALRRREPDAEPFLFPCRPSMLSMITCADTAAQGDLVFSAPEADRWSARELRRRFWKPAVEASGLSPLRPHDPSYGSRALDRGRRDAGGDRDTSWSHLSCDRPRSIRPLFPDSEQKVNALSTCLPRMPASHGARRSYPSARCTRSSWIVSISVSASRGGRLAQRRDGHDRIRPLAGVEGNTSDKSSASKVSKPFESPKVLSWQRAFHSSLDRDDTAVVGSMRRSTPPRLGRQWWRPAIPSSNSPVL